MHPVSIVSDLCQTAVASVGDQESTPKLEYATTIAMSWITLYDPTSDTFGAVFHDKTADGSYMESSKAEGTDKSSTLTLGNAATELEVDWYVRRNEDNSDIWAITAGPSGTTSTQYDLSRQEISSFKADKGKFR